jgi:hypothetical protein
MREAPDEALLGSQSAMSSSNQGMLLAVLRSMTLEQAVEVVC